MRADPSVTSRSLLALAALAVLLAVTPARAQAGDIAGTKHNLSASGTGTVRALSESRICIFCHTPHNATPLTPLWNRELAPRTYTVYTSPTLKAGPLGQPTGASKLCLGCHDGTIAMGSVLEPTGGIMMSGAGTLPPGSLSDFGLDLSGHHPVSFPYGAALPNPELAASPPPDLVYGGVDEVQCTTCHSPHKDTYGKFLVLDHRYSALCIKCHEIPGWAGSAHATSNASVAGILPRPPKTWPTWPTLGEWGCETCHTPHFAPTGPQLLNFTADPPAPFSCTSAGCHSSDPPDQHVASTGGVAARARGADIAGQVKKFSAHHEPVPGADAGLAKAGLAARAASGVVACNDCHAPHASTARKAEAPYASGRLDGVSGVDRYGVEVARVTYEYEVCFKCHADASRNVATVPRVVASTNLRLALDPTNPSFHPVIGPGRERNVPSLASALEPALNAASVIYCTACHADDAGGSRGPHGSNWAPILRERYETTDGTPESYDSYALCYRCHDRGRILADTSFGRKVVAKSARSGGHSGHLAAGAPCSVCHDAHGVNGNAGAGTGSHTHLINFDRRVVAPHGTNTVPLFRDTGTFSGSCTLVCHGVDHADVAYP